MSGVQMKDVVQLPMKGFKKFMRGDTRALVYWHRGANSGLYRFKSMQAAQNTAVEFSNAEGFYHIVVVDLVQGNRYEWNKPKAEKEDTQRTAEQHGGEE